MLDFLIPAATGDPVLLLTIVIILLFTVTILFIPALLAAPSAKPEDIGNAIVSYLLQTFGIILMASAAFPVAVAVLNSFSDPALISVNDIIGPALIFAAGLLILTYFSREAHALESKAVTGINAIYKTTFHLLGIFMAILALLSFALSFILTGSVWQWQMMLVLFLTGMFLSVSFSCHPTKKGILSKVRPKKRKKK